MTKRRVAITGMGVLTPIGIGLDETWSASVAGRSGVAEVSLFDITNYETKIAAEVKNFDPSTYMLPEVFRKTDRFAQLGVAAAVMAFEDAKIASLIDREKNKIPVIIGSGLGGSLFHEEQIFKLLEGKEPRRVLSSSVPRIAPNSVSAFIAMQYKLRGPNLTISTACSSGGNAIAVASQMIESGVADIVVTGGVECPITPFTYAAYQSLRVLAQPIKSLTDVSRPFDKQRNGFVLGEGAGILILEEYEKALARGAKIYALISGYSSNCGAYHMAAPDPSGDDAAMAMQDALLMAGLTPSDVDYINAHGTATKLNDECEAKAIGRVFGAGANGPLVSSTKSMTGHTIGAAGAIEAILTANTIYRGQIPATINCDDVDDACDINIVKTTSIEKKVRHAVSNSLGFGSNNSVLVFSAPNR